MGEKGHFGIRISDFGPFGMLRVSRTQGPVVEPAETNHILICQHGLVKKRMALKDLFKLVEKKYEES